MNIPDLTWNADAATAAQACADSNVANNTFQHCADGFGQNIYEVFGCTGPCPFDVSDAIISSWAAEASDYTWDTNSCASTCGHYTQEVWANTTSIGCGVASGTDPSGHDVTFFACDYAPAGNFTGQRPYEPGPNPPVTVGLLDGAGNAYVKEGDLTSSWIKVAGGASAIAVASDPVHGPLIGVTTGSGFYVKQGNVTGPFTLETASSSSAIALASDATNGALIAVTIASGVYAKQGSLTTLIKQAASASKLAVASDATNGPLIGVTTGSGFYVKQGSVTGPWTLETSSSSTGIALASDATNGALIAVTVASGVYAKQGSLTAPFIKQAASASKLAVASDATNGALIGVTTGSGFYVKQGSLTGSMDARDSELVDRDRARERRHQWRADCREHRERGLRQARKPDRTLDQASGKRQQDRSRRLIGYRPADGRAVAE